ncbi:MAG: hypothetical protein A2Y24_04855 [Clostridiales bacterium GWE2_32_10]|nr:MAG: hypothetical protein A2Y24_04855 [Clostridiales bacterium GWE2_32_10]HBY20312.1 hypothetical protein [Clostridiales bacterium]
MQGTTDSTTANNVLIAIAMFFVLLPIVMLLNSHTNSKYTKLFIIAIFVGIIAIFATGYIYTTPIGKFIINLFEAL